MSEIKKSSWHYKMVNVVLRHHSYNLCAYFWQCVFSLLVMIALACLIVVFLFTCVVSLILTIAFFVCPPFTEYVASLPDDHLLPSLIVVGFILILLAIGFGLFQSMAYLTKCIRLKRSKKEYVISKQPSLVSEYIRSKKENVCPTITFIEDE